MLRLHSGGTAMRLAVIGTPRSAAEILNRLNEVSFNAALMKELRMIALIRQMADAGSLAKLQHVAELVCEHT